MGARRQRHLLGAVGLDRVEALAAALEQDADQIDQHAGRRAPAASTEAA